MPIPVLCPSCQSRLNAPDSAAGKKVKCPKCQTLMLIPGAEPTAAAPPPPASRPAPPPAPPPPAPAPAEDSGNPFAFGGGGDEEEEAPRPRKSGATKKPADRKPAPPPDDDGPMDLGDEPEEDEDRPRKGGKAAGKAAKKGSKPSRALDDDDEEDDRPRGRKKAAKKSSGPPVVLILAVAGVLALGCVGGVGAVAYYYMSGDKTSSTTEKGKGNENKGDGKGGEGGGSKAAVPSGWKKIEPAGWGFKAVFPKQPREEDAPGGGPEGKTFAVEDPKLTCVLMVTKIPKEMPAAVRDSLADKFREIFSTGAGGKSSAPKDITWAGQPAQEFTVELEEPPAGSKSTKDSKTKGKTAPKAGAKPTMTIRVLKTETLIVVGIVGSDTGATKPEEINGFFDNFELVK